jgi:UDP-3-O-[3-hydroxymyristoyl] glucosamine N-acyltransferase
VATGSLTAQAVADLVGGRLSGDGAVTLRRIRSLGSARPDDLAVCSGGRYREDLARTAAGAVLLSRDCADDPGPATRIVVDQPLAAMRTIALAFEGASAPTAHVAATAVLGQGVRLGAGVHVAAHAVIGEGVTLGARVEVGAGAVIEAGTTVGEDSRIGPRAVIHHHVEIGARVSVQAGAVIGSPGFGFLSDAEGHHRIPQLGGCRLEDDVEIGANCCIDRGSLDDTVIGAGTKLDNLVHVAHNVRTGRRCLIMAGVGVAGSTRLGDDVVVAGQAGMAGHLTIGDRARIGAQAGVIANVEAAGAVSGFPARPHREYLRAQAALYRLAPHLATLEALIRRERDA